MYPDIIESRSSTGSKSSKIKSHHNVGGLPKNMNLKLIEPLKEFVKDEVRILGKSLGLVDQKNFEASINFTFRLYLFLSIHFRVQV